MSDGDTRVVYSTATQGRCTGCGWPQRDCKCSRRQGKEAPIPDRLTAKLRLEKSGRAGKAVTVVYDLPDNQTFLKELAGELKRQCGVGGTVGEGTVELQGDQRERVRDALRQRGMTVKG